MLLWMSDGKLFHRIIERGKKLVSVRSMLDVWAGCVRPRKNSPSESYFLLLLLRVILTDDLCVRRT